MPSKQESNLDNKTVEGFGQEWGCFDQANLDPDEAKSLFDAYFSLFPKQYLDGKKIGADVGCGSGRWAKCIIGDVKKLYCIDASGEALSVAKRNLQSHQNVEFLHASVNNIPLADEHLDFAYSLGVLHHIPDTKAGVEAVVKKLKPGAPFLVYLYYALDNKPCWFGAIWKMSDYVRKGVSRLPFRFRLLVCQFIAAVIYFPLARTAYFAENIGLNTNNMPLSIYRNKSFYTMRTDALDRFGTRLEHIFTRDQVKQTLEESGLEKVLVSDQVPYWCALGYKKK